MLNQIIEGISTAINAEFGDGYKCHNENIEQELSAPCFYIQCLNPSQNQFLGKRYFKNNLFVIQYFPQNADYQRECNDVLERLFECLEYITLYDEEKQANEEKPIRGTDMHGEVVNGVLNFMVHYDLFVIKTESFDVMEIMESESTPS